MRTVLLLILLLATPQASQPAPIDQVLAQQYFREAAALCARENGHLWGGALCGPMVLVDPVTKSIAANQPVPDAPRPAAFGFANAAMNWGGTRWSVFVWQQFGPATEGQRGRLMMHELFHRIQPQLNLLSPEGENAHLDTRDGRYWIQLEWRALARALATSGDARTAATRDALAFRAKRFALVSGAAEHERRLLINEGLAEYTGMVASTASRADAIAETLVELDRAAKFESFVRTFPYATGAAYGLLFDEVTPAWTRAVTVTDDVPALFAAAAGLAPSADVLAAADRYGAAALGAAEAQREVAHQAMVRELRTRFVDGPVLVLPNGRNASFVTNGMTPLPGAGTITPSYRVAGDWGLLDAAQVLVSADRQTLALPLPYTRSDTVLRGTNWTLTLNPGWEVRPGPRAGDMVVAKTP